ncbi:GPI-inositol-deacylase [Pilatotrama ljubarskyi]|nr:GPI-inositol-deacylase [Pilatotrama ljubarskyi]
MSRLLAVFSVFSVVAVAVLYYAAVDTLNTLSPQGCRMSWMWPSYVLQSRFDRSWTPLARRYSLWLYREGNLENNELHGSPVLFIPGNAGSSHQVRSIASSAANQYFSGPYQVSPEFANKEYEALDFFAVEFNEDLSAFHGPTIDAQTAFTSRAVDYILSLYPPNKSIIVTGHSMGGIIATALLPNPNISAVITMSSPHTLPPVRFDRRIDHIYADNLKDLESDPTPILSLCGGATDLMIPSESCILPSSLKTNTSVYRRTVFTSALEGCWTGVGHLAMVWCHQVRWRIARAALEVAAVDSLDARAAALDRWLRDGHALPPVHIPSGLLELHLGEYDTVPPNQHLLVRDPVGTRSYLLPLPNPEEGVTSRFVLYASKGSIPPVGPQRPLPFRATVYICTASETVNCSALEPGTLKLIPSPVPGAPFPVPDEGTDESEGVVLYEADIPPGAYSHIAVKVDDGDRRGWIFGGFVDGASIVEDVRLANLLLSSVWLPVPNGVRTEIRLPGLPANALLVYRATPRYHPESSCSADAPLLPLLTHTSHPSETHYYPLAPTFPRRILLHSHASAPYIASEHPVGHKLTVHSSGECWVTEIELTLDWWGSIGRWGTRYWAAAVCWGVGIMGIVLWDVWGLVEGGAAIPDVRSSLEFFARRRLPWLVLSSYFVSLLPLRVGLWLGNGGTPAFAPLAMVLLPIAFGLVSIMWWLLLVLLWPLRLVLRRLARRREEVIARRPMATLLSMGLIFLVIFILVPWQVAFLGCWLIHFYTCAASLADLSLARSQYPSGAEAVPLVALSAASESADSPTSPGGPDDGERQSTASRLPLLQKEANAHLHFLLIMTWLLPLVAPVLAVWVRTLATAGFTTPFDGDHNFLYVAPFLVLVEALSGSDSGRYIRVLFEKKGRLSPRWCFAALAVVAFFLGPRTTYYVFETASAAIGWGVLARIGPLYWGWRSSLRRN